MKQHSKLQLTIRIGSYWPPLRTGQRDDSTLRWSRECLVANRVPGTAKKIYFSFFIGKKAPWLFRLFWGDEEQPHFVYSSFFSMSHYKIPVFNQPGFHRMQPGGFVCMA